MCEKENLASGEALQEAGPADETVAGKADAAAAAPETSGLPAGTGGDAGTQAENTQLKAKKQQPAPEAPELAGRADAPAAIPKEKR